MRYSVTSKTKEEIKRKLCDLYSEPLALSRKILDFDRDYHFFSNNELNMVKYSSKWFNPDRYEQETLRWSTSESALSGHDEAVAVGSAATAPSAKPDDGSLYRTLSKSESVKSIASHHHLTRDLEKLGRTPYHIGMEGEKFRVVAATLQKCNSPFVRRTFQFTPNGIIETPEDGEKSVTTCSGGKKGVTQKLVTIRRFRVIKKDSLAGSSAVAVAAPHKIKVTNGEKPRFLTVRIRSKDRQQTGGEVVAVPAPSRSTPEVIRLTSSTEEEDFDYGEKAASPSAQTTEETDDGEEVVAMKPRKDLEGDESAKKAAVASDDADSNDTDDATDDYQPGQYFRGHVTCHVCSKRFLTSKQMREHARAAHPSGSGAAEDRIKTATSKFGRTRRVLNIAGLRSKYKML